MNLLFVDLVILLSGYNNKFIAENHGNENKLMQQRIKVSGEMIS